MELLFTITPAHTDCRLQAALQREMQQHARQQAALQARMAGWQERWLAPLLLCLGLGGGLLAIARPGQPPSPEKIIAMLVSTVLCILLWKRYSARLLAALRQHQAMRQALPGPAPEAGARRPAPACGAWRAATACSWTIRASR
jgi:hypothetical protein